MERLDRVDLIARQWDREHPGLDLMSMGIVNRIVVLEKHFTKQIAKALEIAGLTIWEFDVLATLRRIGSPFSLPATQLSKISMISGGAMTNRVDHLCERGLVAREPHLENRRIVMVTLTAAGLALVDSSLDTRSSVATRLISALSPKDQEIASRLLRVVLLSCDAIEEE